MKKHLILTASLSLFMTFMLSNCNKPVGPSPNGSGQGTLRTLPPASVPVFDESNFSNEPDNLTSSFVRVASSLIDPGGSTILRHGHVWGTGESFLYYDTINPYKTELGPISTFEDYPYSFTSYIRNLEENTTYSVRAYVVTKDGVFYGPITNFKTKSNNLAQ